MTTDWRKLFVRVAARAGWQAAEIRSMRFRQTCCAAPVRTLDPGAAVSTHTVSRELRHLTAMVERVCSHLG